MDRTKYARVALLFTDASGQVVFVDNNFIRMMNRSEASTAVREPLHEVLGLDHETAVQLLRDIAQTGYVQQRMLDVLDTTGTIVRVSCTGMATYDDQETFVGADITLQEVASPGTPEAQSIFHQDSLEVLIREVHAEIKIVEDHTRLQPYFTAQVYALQRLLLRVGGTRLTENLEAIVNETAQRNGWPISMKEGHVEIEISSTELDIHHRALLAKAVTYAVSVIGRHMVTREMQAVDELMDVKTIELATQLGLRELFNDSL